jgi:hypothetical protein
MLLPALFLPVSLKRLNKSGSLLCTTYCYNMANTQDVPSEAGYFTDPDDSRYMRQWTGTGWGAHRYLQLELEYQNPADLKTSNATKWEKRNNQIVFSLNDKSKPRPI